MTLPDDSEREDRDEREREEDFYAELQMERWWEERRANAR